MEEKKPIAERLKEYADNNNLLFDFGNGEHCGIPTWAARKFANEIEAEQKELAERLTVQTHGDVSELGVSFAAFADCYLKMPLLDGENIPEWLERNFAKLPCDRAGEPWHIGDETDKGKISGFTIHELYPESRVMIHRNGMDNHATCFEPGELERTEKEPVLDADGVEIKVGDTVYIKSGDDAHPYEVDRITDNGSAHFNGESFGIAHYPETLIHERPVFDADGVRICKGDTVWHVSGESYAWKVEKIDGTGAVFCYSDYDNKTIPFDGDRLTHCEPDSLEKLRDDMKDVWENWTPKEMEGEWVDRLTALMERGA